MVHVGEHLFAMGECDRPDRILQAGFSCGPLETGRNGAPERFDRPRALAPDAQEPLCSRITTCPVISKPRSRASSSTTITDAITKAYETSRRARLQHRRRGLLNPLDNSFGATGPEPANLRAAATHECADNRSASASRQSRKSAFSEAPAQAGENSNDTSHGRPELLGKPCGSTRGTHSVRNRKDQSGFKRIPCFGSLIANPSTY